MKEAKKPIDLDKYIGSGKAWHELASFPAWFQRECKNATAEYARREGFVEVKNTCDREGKRDVKIGKAFTTDRDNVLKVQFQWPFKADYVIEYVDDAYTNAVVGSTGKRYLWLLSRKPTQKNLEILTEKAREKGYDVGRLRVTRTKQPVQDQ